MCCVSNTFFFTWIFPTQNEEKSSGEAFSAFYVCYSWKKTGGPKTVEIDDVVNV
jgi:hypothetical protein